MNSVITAVHNTMKSCKNSQESCFAPKHFLFVSRVDGGAVRTECFSGTTKSWKSLCLKLTINRRTLK